MGVGQRMRLARREAGIKQKEAADKLGMQPADLSRIELERPGARELRAGEIIAAALMYNRSTDWLLGLSDGIDLTPDLVWRWKQLPPTLTRPLLETAVYVLFDHLEDGLLKDVPSDLQK